MKISVVSSPLIATPPIQGYGGMERICYWLARDLVSRGHDVTLCGRTGSRLEGYGSRVIEYTGGEDQGYADLLHELITGGDVIHDITHDKLLTRYYPELKGQTIATLQAMAQRGPNTTCISFAQRRELGYDDTIPVIYNRVPTAEYLPIPNPTADYILYMGSINDYKGVDIAVEVCHKLGQKLIIAGVAWDSDYFDRMIKPKLTDDITWFGEAGGEIKLNLIQNARALFHPVRWCEAGAIIVSEALSCGVPIIGSNNGILPELVHPAVGRLAHVQHFDHYPKMQGGHYDVDAMERAVLSIDEVSREDCAEYARQKLDFTLSTDQYLFQYERIMNGETW